jgi:guanylate kinase
MSKLIIITAPSGAGKTTIVRHLLASFSELAFSISATTRARRPHESEGVDYYFLSPEEFRSRVDAGGFIEWEEVYENQYYGTLKSEVERLWKADKHIIFDIEVKGALNIQKAYPDNSLSIFVQPPSEEILFARLRNRKTESEENLRKRIDRAAMELSCAHLFDRILVNDILSDTLAEAEDMVSSYLML